MLTGRLGHCYILTSINGALCDHLFLHTLSQAHQAYRALANLIFVIFGHLNLLTVVVIVELHPFGHEKPAASYALQIDEQDLCCYEHNHDEAQRVIR